MEVSKNETNHFNENFLFIYFNVKAISHNYLIFHLSEFTI